MNPERKRIAGAKGIVALLIAVVGACVFFVWNPVVSHFVVQKSESAAKKRGWSISIGGIESGFFAVSMRNVRLKKNDGGDEIAVSTVYAEPDFSSMLAGRIGLDKLVIDTVRFVKPEKPLPVAQPENGGDSVSAVRFPSILKPLQQVLTLLEDRSFPEVSVAAVSGQFHAGDSVIMVYSGNFYLNSDSVSLTIVSSALELSARGRFNEKGLQINLTQPLAISLPLPEPFTVRSNVTEGTVSIVPEMGRTLINGALSGVDIHCEALAPGPFSLADITVSAAVAIAEKEISIQAKAGLNDLSLTYDASYAETTALPVTRQSLQLEPATAASYHRSLPEAFIGKLRGLEFEGKLGYSLLCEIDFNAVDSLKLSASVLKDQFRLTHTGIDIERLNGSFYQDVYDGLAVKRQVHVSLKNPLYTPFPEIPQMLIDAILTSEDVGFFRHRGFSEGGFRSALADNLKSRKFKRGASTISMQLVKNVFLTREKTVARKFQELVITWLLENSGSISKESMLEIYLNIIEWGPDVYGAGEASQYYFRKKPDALTLEESLFLATIIPFPKRFHRRFKDGQLRQSAIQSMTFVAKKMGQFNFIEPDRHEHLDFSRLILTGKARNVVSPEDSLDTFEELFESFR
jgi:hypothetical protein